MWRVRTSGADVAKGTFYLYFSSKDDLCAAFGEGGADCVARNGVIALGRAQQSALQSSDWRSLGLWRRIESVKTPGLGR
ncbi:TetR/AcrR family transcriptional regulator [Methylocapsa sp. S129]|uniref:TetR/AcrR family transcriptional regulator n=1 Tax=Methylocapsa sp. S129 TaxID=1641869 RepID=UPI00131B53F3|nr:TetR/AcrR family transcriptional regulator [Methylocapsa sp. S129]